MSVDVVDIAGTRSGSENATANGTVRIAGQTLRAAKCYGGRMDLAYFIDSERVAIVAEWETFARTLLPAAEGMSPTALRDHANQILTAIVRDMRSRQTLAEQAAKSKGRGDAQNLGEMGQVHAALRIAFGFNLVQMVAEYRALRASVLRLWENKGSDPGGVTRFNEAIDEALTEAVTTFTTTTEHYRDQSLGILGHDLRNPVAAIITGSTLLIDSEKLDDRSVRIAARMLNSANRMNRMIGDLLDLTRTRFGDAIPIVRGAMDLDPLCRQVIAELEGLRPSGGVQFETKGNLRGDWDSDRIAQVLSNLVRNAIQYGGKVDPIRVVAEDMGAEVLVAVHNGGRTIPPGVLTTIFDPMVRHSAEGYTHTGLGLGLYIASQIVSSHGGKIIATSTDAAGTAFSIRLPRHASSPKPTPSEEEMAATSVYFAHTDCTLDPNDWCPAEKLVRPRAPLASKQRPRCAAALPNDPTGM
ncbi:MAG: HAMP domain-containing histidine kinase [Myxococcota bacterium]|nr:HAMP domain-containing histidine kinase [Myxococcota bacterium]